MSKRFTETEVWKDDWFLSLPLEYKLFWFYLKDNCNHAGIFKVNLRSFSLLNEVKITPKEVLELFNKDKDRIRVLSDNKWYLEDFYFFQYGTTMNLKNRVHKSIHKQYEIENISITSIRGLKDLKDRVKDKDKDKDKDIDNNILYEIEKLKTFYLENDKLCNVICKSFTITLDELKLKLDKFNNELNLKDINVRKWEDYTSHFLNWLRIKKDKEVVERKSNRIPL